MPSQLPKVFISYSHRDKRWRAELETHLKPYLRGGSIVSWSDEQIAPGSEWLKEIQFALVNSKVAVLLVSPDFLASDFIHEHELGPLLKEAEQGGVRILWVHVHESAYMQTPLKNYQAVLDPGKPLDGMTKAKRDQAWVEICENIVKAVDGPAEFPGAHLSVEINDMMGDIVAGERVIFLKEDARFTDLTLYKGHVFPDDNPAVVNRLLESEALRPGSKYTLEVAIRQERSGIGAATPALRAVLNPRRTTETLTIFVVARTLYGPAVIDDAVVAIDWPYNADSDPAFFRITVPATLPEPALQAMVEVRLYHANLDLLDVIRLVVHVTADTDVETPPSRIDWPRLSNAEPRLDPDGVIRELTIRVSPASEGYSLEFILRRGERDVSLPFERNLKVGDLETLLAKVRDFWTELVITNYESKLSVTFPTWKRYLERLYELGTDAWELLFGSRTGSQKGASETMGDLLAQTELAAGSHVQVTYANGLTDFVFPWSILYPPGDPGTAVDPLRFWGARYQVEQVWGGASQDRLEIEPVGVVVTADPGFGEAQLEIDMFERFRAEAAGRLDLDTPIADREKLFTALSSAPSRHLYYFFCHGYAPAGPSLTGRDGIKVLRESIEALPTPQRKPWDTLLALTAKMADEPWMFIGNAQITESALRRKRNYFSQRRPILFLNMCHSAALAPSMTRGLVRLFLDRDAAAIIGTESPMTPVFAHAFSNEVLSDLFRGYNIGTALWRARRHFLADEIRNPLGFVYTLYGRATVRLGSGPLTTAPRHEEASPR